MPELDLAEMWRPELHPLEVVARAAIVYLFVYGVFRVVGRKAMQRWGPSEVVLLFLVTVSLRKSIVAEDASITSAAIALCTIVALDRLLTTLAFRWPRAATLLEGPAIRLVRAGALDREGMRRARISEEELLGRVRARGRERLDDVRDAWFERSGEVTVVFRD